MVSSAAAGPPCSSTGLPLLDLVQIRPSGLVASPTAPVKESSERPLYHIHHSSPTFRTEGYLAWVESKAPAGPRGSRTWPIFLTGKVGPPCAGAFACRADRERLPEAQVARKARRDRQGKTFFCIYLAFSDPATETPVSIYTGQSLFNSPRKSLFQRILAATGHPPGPFSIARGFR